VTGGAPAGIAVHKALAQGQLRGEQIACVGFSGQMHGAVLLDAHERIVRPLLSGVTSGLRSNAKTGTQSVAERLIQLTCNPALPKFHSDEMFVGRGK